MLARRNYFLLITIVILLLSIVSAVQAAPPGQGPPHKSKHDSFNLDDDGNVDHQNLGTIMPGPKDERPTDPSQAHPVLTRVANYFDEDYDDIKALHDDGHGIGIIVKAFFFAQEFGGTGYDLLDGGVRGWGKILKEQGIHPGTVHGQGGPPDHAGKPDKANKSADDDADGPGKGQGKGQNKGVDDEDADDNDDADVDDADDGDNDDDDADDDGNGPGNSQGKGKGKGKNN